MMADFKRQCQGASHARFSPSSALWMSCRVLPRNSAASAQNRASQLRGLSPAPVRYRILKPLENQCAAWGRIKGSRKQSLGSCYTKRFSDVHDRGMPM